jgi:hypothetical protein
MVNVFATGEVERELESRFSVVSSPGLKNIYFFYNRGS